MTRTSWTASRWGRELWTGGWMVRDTHVLLTCSTCLQVLDGRIYEQVKDYLVSLCQTELETYQAVHNTFNHLLNSSNGVRLQTSLSYPSQGSPDQVLWLQSRSEWFDVQDSAVKESDLMFVWVYIVKINVYIAAEDLIFHKLLDPNPEGPDSKIWS